MLEKCIEGAKSLIFAVVLLVLSPAFLPAQTAAELEAVLETSAVTCAQAARFVTASSESAAASEGQSAPLTDADFQQAVEKGWFPRGTEPDENISLGKLSFLIMRAFNLRGGMMYAIFPGPHYAFRTMVSRSFIQGSADPAMTVNGERFLLILGRVLNTEGGES
jgi:hypothetical protein